MMKKRTIKTKIADETKQLGEEIGRSLLQDGGVVALYGELGSGKTTFVLGLSGVYEVEDKVSSPTFVLQKEYKVDDKKYSINKIYHIDLYRLPEYTNDELGINDLASEGKNIIIIEWADRMQDILPKKRIDIYFSYLSPNEREITVEDNSNE